MTKVTTEEINCEKFTVANAADLLIKSVGADKKVKAAFIVIRTEGEQAVIPMGDALEQFGLLASGAIEKAVKETIKIVKSELLKHFTSFVDELTEKHSGDGGGE